jgi:nucleotide-binding universal stress UspA family protein
VISRPGRSPERSRGRSAGRNPIRSPERSPEHRPEHRTDRVPGRIVVGLDHTPSGSAALRWAAAQAVLRGWDVLVVRAFTLPVRPERILERDLESARRQARDRAQRWAVDVLADVDSRPTLRVRQTDGEVVPVLVRSARNAELLVIGTPSGDDVLLETLAVRTPCPLVHVDEDGSAHDVFSLAEAGLG